MPLALRNLPPPHWVHAGPSTPTSQRRQRPPPISTGHLQAWPCSSRRLSHVNGLRHVNQQTNELR
eukprot:m.928751 g.928751  ORF g.928751 m.928751 type:complete len:65 (-) comp23779_c1_seq7:1129-1323(-)